jgi:LPS sulfotransferase NodH
VTAAASPLADALVLVFGCPRSGTTWLTRLLLSHPQAAGPEHSESRLFTDLQPFATALEHRMADGPLAYVEERTLVAALRQFCDDLLGADLQGRRRVFEKTPANALQLPFIRRIYPDAWYIHIVRDGRDVTRSVSEVEFGQADVSEGAAGWVEYLRAVERDAPGLARFREVRYEDLLAEPVAGVSELLSWVGLEVDDQVRDSIAERAGTRVSQFNTGGQVGAGKWRELTQEQLRDIYRVAGDLLITRGYAERAEVERALAGRSGGPRRP